MTHSTGSSTKPRSNFLGAILFVLVVAGIAAAGIFGWRSITEAGEGAKEAEAQKPEIEACKTNLAAFNTAWNAFRKDHKGQDPASINDIVPKYISDKKLLVCPTAQRWLDKKSAMQFGTVKVNGQDWRETYGFRVFTASYPRDLKKHGDKSIIIACDAHQEAAYRAVYHRPPPVGAFEESQRAQLAGPVKDTKLVVLRRNGSVEVAADNE